MTGRDERPVAPGGWTRHPMSAAANAEVRTLAAAATRADGAPPFSERTLLGLRGSGTAPDGVTHVLAGATLTEGYAQVAADGTTELAVHPDHRRRGHGRRLLETAATIAGADLRVWSYARHPGAAALAASTGLAAVRELHRMRRPLPLGSEHDPPGPVPLPAGVTVRTFDPATDADAWLALNARAFAGHREQGRLTRADLDARIGEPWFDPAGFFLAFRDGRLVGFHWTKVHPGDPAAGEIYVLGVDPTGHGAGLGRALSRIGLRHLAAAGLGSVLLYVDGDNAPALAVYRRLGFVTESVAVLFG